MYAPRLCSVAQLFLLVIVHNMFSRQFQHAQITLQMDLKGKKIQEPIMYNYHPHMQ
jgi:hypothetical protein